MEDTQSCLRPAIRAAKGLVDTQRRMTLEELNVNALLELIRLQEAVLRITWDEHN